jgi:putative phosphoesterase
MAKISHKNIQGCSNIMKIGVLSDTHIHSLDAGIALAEKLLNGPFRNVDVVLHAGDHVFAELSSCFYPLPWYGVQGNMDRSDAGLPVQRIIRLGGYSIAMTHGWGASQGLETRVLQSFSQEDADIVIYGHSHYPVCRKVGSLLVINPGSPTDKRKASFHTVGLLTLGTVAHGEIIRLD